MWFDFEDARLADVAHVTRDVLVGEHPGVRIQDGFGDIGDPDAVGQSHIIMLRATHASANSPATSDGRTFFMRTLVLPSSQNHKLKIQSRHPLLPAMGQQ